MKNKTLWSTKDLIKITAFIVASSGTLLLGVYLLKNFIDFQPPILALIVDFGLVLSIIITYYVYAKKKELNRFDLGFKNVKMRWLFLSVLVGLFVVFVGGGLSALLSKLLSSDVSMIEEGVISNKLWLNLFNFKLLIGILVPIAEEIYFRGVLFKYFRGGYTFIYAGLISSFIFSAIHFDLVLLPFTFTLGFASAYLFEKTQSIFPSFFVHITANSVAVSMFLMGICFG